MKISSENGEEKLLPEVKYNPYRIPPNLQLCEIHYKATTFGSTLKNSKECPCCWEREKQLFPICSSNNDIGQV